MIMKIKFVTTKHFVTDLLKKEIQKQKEKRFIVVSQVNLHNFNSFLV